MVGIQIFSPLLFPILTNFALSIFVADTVPGSRDQNTFKLDLLIVLNSNVSSLSSFEFVSFKFLK